MRIYESNPDYRGTEFSNEIRLMQNITFTADAIQQLSTGITKIDLKEWIWHEETINGITFCIVTSKKENIA